MRILIPGLLLLAAVHGVTVTVHGSFGHSVLLPCNCTGRDLEKEFKWEMKSPHVKPVFIYNRSETFGYQDRITTFVDQDPYNCSILLSKIKMEDNGTYLCRFHAPAYTTNKINLIVSAKFDVCVKRVSGNVFQCNVTGLYEEAMILWRLNGSILTDSSTLKITENRDRNAIHTFSSQLISTVNMTPEPTCDVKAGDAPFIIAGPCPGLLFEVPDKTTQENVWMYFIIIPIMLGILGIITYFACRFRLSRWGGESEH